MKKISIASEEIVLAGAKWTRRFVGDLTIGISTDLENYRLHLVEREDFQSGKKLWNIQLDELKAGKLVSTVYDGATASEVRHLSAEKAAEEALSWV